jgi:tetratricopeptide (TPR) repeat protein
MKLVNKSAELAELRSDASASPQKKPSRRLRRTLIIIASVVLVLLLAGGGYLIFLPRVQPLTLPSLPAHLTSADLGLANWQEYQLPLPPHPLTDPRLPGAPRVDASLALLEDAAGQALVQQGQLDRGLAYLQAATQSDNQNQRYSNDYRVALRNHRRYDDEMKYFSQLAQHDTSPATMINFALVYVDEMRACPAPPDGLVCQAQDSYRSIDTLNKVLAAHPYNIMARFARGLNHLYWPRLMGHLPASQTDLEYSVALTRSFPAILQTFIPQAYVALGDVFAKDGQVQTARNVWLNGKEVLSVSSLLDARLAIPQDRLTDEENNTIRGLGVPVETDLTIFW